MSIDILTFLLENCYNKSVVIAQQEEKMNSQAAGDVITKPHLEPYNLSGAKKKKTKQKRKLKINSAARNVLEVLTQQNPS